MKRFVALWRETYRSQPGKQTKYSERDCVRSTSRSSLAGARPLKFSPVSRAVERAAAGLLDTAALRRIKNWCSNCKIFSFRVIRVFRG